MKVPEIAMGGDHACFAVLDGTLVCWGSSAFGQLGDPSIAPGVQAHRPTPMAVVLPALAQDESAYRDSADRLLALAAGSLHTCFVDRSGAPYCFGHNAFGELGNGSTNDSASPVRVSALRDVTQIEAGEGFTCALTKRGVVFCVGKNDLGQLGDGEDGKDGADRKEASRAIPGNVAGLEGVIDIAVGAAHACALDRVGVSCWGYAAEGQLGDGTRGEPSGFRPTPVRVGLPEPVIDIEAGGGHTCARTQAGAVYCFGRNDSGQLADGKKLDPERVTLEPAKVTTARPVVEMALGSRHTCFRYADGTVECAGLAHRGQLGDGRDLENEEEDAARSTLAPVIGVARAERIEAGAHFTGAVVRTATGPFELKTWGANQRGQLGVGTTDDSSVAVTVALQ